MKVKKIQLIVFFIIKVVLSGVTTSSADEVLKPTDFPTQPLTIIIPGSPGAGSHRLSVTMATLLEQVIENRVNFINKPGYNGKTAIEYYVSLPPNGYTILQHFDNVSSLFVEGQVDIDPTRDLIPLAITQLTFSELYIRSNETRFQDWNSFMAYARANPGRIKIALLGRKGSLESLLLGMLEQVEGLDFVPVSFERSAQRYMSVIEENSDALIEQPGDVKPFLDKGLIQSILTLSPRDPPLADQPEEIDTLLRFRGFFVHAAIPPERLKYLEWALAQAFKKPTFRAFNRELQMLSDSHRDTEGSIQFIRDNIATYRRLINPE